MSTPASRGASYDDLLALPDKVVGQIVDGELVVHPRPAPSHAVATSAVGGSLSSPFQFGEGGPGGWWILDEPEVHIEADVVVPDLAGWRKENLPSIPDEAYFSVRPDWICEVLSPSTARFDRVKKVPLYGRAGVAHLWLVDPDARTLEAYRSDGANWVLIATHGGEEVVRVEPFEAMEMKLGRVWGVG